MDSLSFFPQHSCIRALPNGQAPRLFLTGKTVRKRWRESAAYPAYRSPAKIYRLFLRMKVACGFGKSWLADSKPWIVGGFLHGVLSDVQSTVVLVGTPGPSQKLIIQLWDNHRIIAYLKYAESPRAQMLLQREADILLSLPKGLSPTVLKYGQLKQGFGLLITPVIGRQIPAKLPPSTLLLSFLRSLDTVDEIALEKHPWVSSYLLKFGEDNIMPWLSILAGRSWSITRHHGDFAPWNLLVNHENRVVAIDWEYGFRDGFPLLDLAYYVLQVAKLIYRWAPDYAFTYTVNYLRSNVDMKLSLPEAKAITCLTAYLLFKRARDEGHAEDSQIQKWHRAVWGKK